MTQDSNSAVGQIETSNEGLAKYFNSLNKYLTDTTSNILPPDFQEVIDILDYSELHRLTFTRVNDSASYENGAAIENVHQMVSLIREFSMASKRKTDYYRDAGSEANIESNFYANMKIFWINMLKSNYTEGATS